MYIFPLSEYKPYYTTGIFLLVFSFLFVRYALGVIVSCLEYGGSIESGFWIFLLMYLAFIWLIKGVFNARSVQYDADSLYTKQFLTRKRKMIPMEYLISTRKTSFRLGVHFFEYKIRYTSDGKNKHFYTMISHASFKPFLTVLRTKNEKVHKVLEEDLEIPFT